jgi:hypothetical protein
MFIAKLNLRALAATLNLKPAAHVMRRVHGNRTHADGSH